tara:strand:+ start:1311 stop:2078 length:768 start_codon:yes stop_codon:yes gene_type:complete
MQAVILAGGLGTRITEETQLKPKPMIEIGGKPLLWHIMKIYSYFGINEFIICCGYKGYCIKEYFSSYMMHASDITIDFSLRDIKYHNYIPESWKITMVDTGENTMTGSRIKKIKNYIKDETFCMTYGDGLSDVNIKELIKFHNDSGKIATLTAVKPPGRFGSLDLKDNFVDRFIEKPEGDGAYINGGFFVLNKRIFNYIQDDESTVWEQEPLNKLSMDNELMAYKHEGFWRPLDTLRDKIYLEQIWDKGAPWIKS